MWVGLNQSVERSYEQNQSFLEEILPQDFSINSCLSFQSANLPSRL